MSISVVIIKPTKHCNAECTYCAAPPEVNAGPNDKWSVDRFKRYFDAIQEGLTPGATLIWHGGEPMLMPPEFYRAAHEYAWSIRPHIRFAMQTNLLLYSSKRWRDLFREDLKGNISTSFDPDERHREYKGNTELYTRLFMDRLNTAIDDGFNPVVIGTYTEETMQSAFDMYEWAVAMGKRAPSLRMNYRYPAGRASEEGAAIDPATYGEALLRLYDRWIVELPPFGIVPLEQMFKKTIGLESSRCPWMKDCGGRFLEIEPNGDVYNCSDFADMGDTSYSFGNLDVHDLAHLMSSPAAVAMRRRRYDVPADCLACPHFQQCEGGCTRDSVLFGRGLGGKFYYCQSWKMVFNRIKESIATGEADGLIRRFGRNPDAVRSMCGFAPLAARETVPA
jgi:radical SAM additional 4Fe4S-binding domain